MTEEGWREPFAAARSGDRMTVLRMVDDDRSVLELRDPSGVTLLHVAAERDDVELWAGADIRAKGYFGASALHWAAINGHEEIVRWLVDSGAETELHDPRFESTPGGWARERGHERLALLIEAGSSPAEEES
jgi:ankyrin repeat protein